ncbi:hypothetical protein SKAU_G00138410 [Synaphobranchus kaupii]|uniref:Gypsy retrotransposon integrase-like protein 1 n=1 Tax=Synaphobranchus kaupii TaxID=118154 RepID=A0A9Q1FSM4_SYNKA|nr:hypothetical protein SKAU_G00138410 [Synaphobranchus kaupii]
MTEIKYIGHILSASGLKPDEEKVRAVVQLPPPEDKQELLRFRGMIQYLAKFIPNLSEMQARKEWVLSYYRRSFKEEISCTDELLFKAEKLIVPQQLRQEMLSKIHESHLGIVKCKARARDILYWPGMSTQIEEIVSQCAACNENKNSNPREPLIPHPLPGRPWEKIGTDLFHHKGSEFLLWVDYFSKYPEIAKLSDTNSRGVITSMKSMFARHGIPDIVVSDNGPQYASAEFKTFTESWEFEHVTSSPKHAQSNGQAERMVQTIKNLLKKSVQ